MRVFSRKKKAAGSKKAPSKPQGTQSIASSTLPSKNGSSGQRLQWNGQPSNVQPVSIRRSIGIPKGSKRNKTDNTTSYKEVSNTKQSNKGFSLNDAMQQEIIRHRGTKARNVSPDPTEEGSSSGSETSNDSSLFEIKNSVEALSLYLCKQSNQPSDTPVEVSSNSSGSDSEDSLDTKDTREGMYVCGAIEGFECKQSNQPADTPVEVSSNSSGSDSEDSLDTKDTREGMYVCGAIEGFENGDNESVADSENKSVSQLSMTATPLVGTPGMFDISNWLCAADYDHLHSDQKKRVDKNEAADLNRHQGQLDIYGTGSSPKSLKLRRYSNSPRPEMTDHILVKVEASTVSIRDYLDRSTGDLEVPGRQVMGEVYRVGKLARRINNIQVGDRIVALTPNGRGNARFISIPVSSAIPIPSNVQRDDAICLIESYMSAYQMLNLGRTNGTPYTDENVLIVGGSDPVGQALVELALKEGADVTATAPESHREYLEKMGATWFPEEPKKIYRKLSGTMDMVIDTQCLDDYKSSYAALSSDGGKLICTANPPIRDHGSIFDRMGRSVTRFGDSFLSNVSYYDIHKSFQDDPLTFEHEFRYLLVKLQNEEIKPKISGRVALNQVPKAQTMVERGLPNGTVVVLPWEKLDPTQSIPVINVSG